MCKKSATKVVLSFVFIVKALQSQQLQLLSTNSLWEMMAPSQHWSSSCGRFYFYSQGENVDCAVETTKTELALPGFPRFLVCRKHESDRVVLFSGYVDSLIPAAVAAKHVKAYQSSLLHPSPLNKPSHFMLWLYSMYRLWWNRISSCSEWPELNTVVCSNSCVQQL